MDGLRGDVSELTAEVSRARTRLHNLEGFAQAYLDTQKANRRQEEQQYRRLSNKVALGGLAMAVGMLVLTAVTLVMHHG